ncbi:uncharacterized protein LOC116176353 isoform X2 [Photinus pyralis]|uniref:uncharacterized protein LOC116159694 isoform X3 n=1 Tax=Photinus pyralis TaxID=7054 RepID=UPI0012671CB5|nr:uncharacterized protein LOC116159694 isoform X3 [Photinus pyralis]XP_031350744.1 uncharacterized protein LOC116176353 isoform X2 [Photinus pyralis]
MTICLDYYLQGEMFSLVEFAEESGGGLAIIRTEWFTPRKQEAFWPPTKQSKTFEKVLLNEDQVIDNKWKLCFVRRTLFESDDYERVKRKLPRAEYTSDLQSSEAEVGSQGDADQDKFQKRKRAPSRRLLSSSSDEEQTSKFPRPPTLNLNKQIRHVPSPRQLEICEPVPDLSSEQSIASTSQSSHNDNNTTLASCLSLQKKLVNDIIFIKEQNKLIIELLRQQKLTQEKIQFENALPANFPVKLPVNAEQEIQLLEQYLTIQDNYDLLRCHLSTFGGKNINDTTSNILKRVINDSVACSYNYLGTRSNKKPFSQLSLKKVVVDAVKAKQPQAVECDIEQVIKGWLKHAPQRCKLKKSKDTVESNT